MKTTLVKTTVNVFVRLAKMAVGMGGIKETALRASPHQNYPSSKRHQAMAHHIRCAEGGLDPLIPQGRSR